MTHREPSPPTNPTQNPPSAPDTSGVPEHPSLLTLQADHPGTLGDQLLAILRPDEP